MSYTVKSLFLTLQGEGVRSGEAAVFLRFAGCNLWSGRAEDRNTAACRFCDTDFVGCDGPGGGRYADAEVLVRAVATCWAAGVPTPRGRRVVVTGGEPTLQLDTALCAALHDAGFTVAVETNGTHPVPAGVDWITVSPKAGAPLAQTRGDELKLVWPQPGLTEADLPALEALTFDHFLIQPRDDGDLVSHQAACVALCQRRPPWRLSLQTHKLLGLP